jgi:hypothetical protein
LEAERFMEELKAEMEAGLQELDAGMPKNEKVRISGGPVGESRSRSSNPAPFRRTSMP